MNQIFYEVYLVPTNLNFMSYVVSFLCVELVNKTKPGFLTLPMKIVCYGRDPLHEQAHKNDHFYHFSSNSRKSRVSGQFHAKISPEMKQIGVFYV